VTGADQAVSELRESLARRGDPALVTALQRYFPDGVHALGVRNAEVVALANGWFADHPTSPQERLDLAELLLQQAAYHEEVLLGFALLHKVVRRNFDDTLLDRCRAWLESVVSNWAQCDDLCLKLIYPFFLGHPDLITTTQAWLGSPSPWARRAANVSVVKFVRRKIGSQTYELPLDLVFDNALRLIDDPEPYVQKSVGWLLKVTAQVHPLQVSDFLHEHGAAMKRDTLRDAIEKYEPGVRMELLALGREGSRRVRSRGSRRRSARAGR
jgi:3-methyladenine DNA glycosylase AlkD